MTAARIIEMLAAFGIRLSTTDGKLIVDAPAGVLTAEMKAELTTHKPELLTLLALKPCNRCGASMLRIEFGYFACACGYQAVESRSGFWVAALNRQPESCNFCATCGAWLNDEGDCFQCALQPHLTKKRIASQYR